MYSEHDKKCNYINDKCFHVCTVINRIFRHKTRKDTIIKIYKTIYNKIYMYTVYFALKRHIEIASIWLNYMARPINQFF